MSFDSEDLDPLGWHAGGSPTLVTPNIAGYYRVTFVCNWATDADLSRQYIEVQRNTAATFPIRRFDFDSAADGNQMTVMCGSVPLIGMNGSGDTIRLTAFQANTSAGANGIDAAVLVELVYPT